MTGLRAAVRWGMLGEPFERVYRTAAQWEWLSPEEIENRQRALVDDIVAAARGTGAWYRSRLERPGDVPPLSRAELVAQLATRRGPRWLVRTSGGSSGAVVPVPMSRALYAWYLAGTVRGFRWWGVDLWSRGAVLLGPGTGSLIRSAAMRLKDWAMQWLRIEVDPTFDTRVTDAAARVDAYDPLFLYGYPSAVERLASASRPRGNRRLQVVVVTGEPLHDYQRRRIAGAFQVPVVQEYGAGELGSMAFACPEGSLHVAAECVRLETESPAGGALLATHLRNTLFPLIRYRTGDLGRIDTMTCRCGRGLPVVTVAGRERDRLVGPDGEPASSDTFETLLTHLPERLLGRIQLVHTRPGHLVARVATGPGAEMNGLPGRLAALLGPRWQSSVVEVPFLRRLPSGKLPLFVRTRSVR